MSEHLDHLGRAEAAKADWRTLTRTLTTPDFDNEDPDLMGSKPPASQQKLLDDAHNSKHAHNQKTRMGRFVGVLKAFPVFWVNTNLGILIPTLVNCAVAILYGAWARNMINESGDRAGILYDFEIYYLQYRNFGSVGLSMVKSGFGSVVIIYVLYLMMANMYNLKPIRKKLAWYFAIPCITILSVAVGNQLLAWQGETFFAERYFVVQVQCYGTAFALFGVMIGRHTKQPNLWWQWSYYVVMYSILMISIDYAFIRFNVYQHMPDAEKVVIASVVIPLAFELLLTTPARYMIRTWRHHHESTSICLIALSMATSKGLSRLLISLVKDVNMVTLGSLLMGFAEFGSVSSVRLRDRLGYFFMGYALEDPQEAFATMRAHKNKFLRVRLAHLETQLELSFTISSLFLVYIMDTSMDNEAPFAKPTASALFTSFSIQYGSEIVVEFICIAWLTVMDCQPILVVAHENFWGFTWFIGWMGALVTIYTATFLFPRVLEHEPGDLATWKFV